MGQCVLWIESNGLSVVLAGLSHRFPRYLPMVMLCLQQSFVSRKTGCIPWLCGWLRRKTGVKSFRNCRGDFVLHREHICQFPVITLGPQVTPIGSSDQLCGNAYSIA